MQHVTSRGVSIATNVLRGAAPLTMFLPGFASDMRGEKAEYVARWCAGRGLGCVRFDYSGHGDSGGRFADGTIGGWRDDTLSVIDATGDADLVLVGSSMGGWIALLAALARPDRVRALLLIAPAPDFTTDLMWDAMAPAERETLLRDGVLHVPSAYGPPFALSLTLIQEGRDHALLGRPIPLDLPVRILHGQNDPDVPWERSLTLARQLRAADVRVTLIKDGDHRLSRPSDLDLLGATLAELHAALGGQDGGQPLAVAGVGPAPV
jgi:pimeloyl-ACP methyl ester carboxylesterase